jgi:hypothetical protein
MTKTDITKKAMIEALEKSLGIVTTACKSVDIARQTHYEWLREDPNYKEQVESIVDMAIDFAESQLNQLIQGAKHQVVTNKGDIVEIKDAPNATSIIFFLKTKGKKRGYVETTETIFTEKEIFKSLDIDVPSDYGTTIDTI